MLKDLVPPTTERGVHYCIIHHRSNEWKTSGRYINENDEYICIEVMGHAGAFLGHKAIPKHEVLHIDFLTKEDIPWLNQSPS